MAVLVIDPEIESAIMSDRRNSDGERFDEVWEGVYVMVPLPNDEHQEIQANFVAAIKDACGWDSPAKVRAGVNLSDRNEQWHRNYRCPDVAVFLPGNTSINHGSHWEGGPDFLVEILSEGDRAIGKLPFYEKLGVREILVVHRNPWALELHALGASTPNSRANTRIELDSDGKLPSAVLPVSFELISSTARPLIKVTLVVVPREGQLLGRTFWLV